MKVHLVNLGCARNLVDGEIMLGRLTEAGWEVTDGPENADTVVVNTCSFIQAAADESIDTILEIARRKPLGCTLIVSGCLPQRYGLDIVNTLPEVDIFLGTGAYDRITEAAEGSLEENILLPDPDELPPASWDVPRLRPSSHLAYVRVAEGCSRNCRYCIIPRLRGRQKSRPVNDILIECRDLISEGVQELVLVAQDTTAYGADLNPPADLARLLQELAVGAPDMWIRFLYGHPSSINEQTLRTVAEHPNICTYFDLPVQHASDRVLKQMGREYVRKDLHRLFDTIRRIAPEAILRTTLLVGFPGETEADFAELMAFMEAVRFDHLGVFPYSDADDLPSHKLGEHVDPELTQARYDRLMARQMEIAGQKNQRHVGEVLDILIEEKAAQDTFTGRAWFQAPEVDGVTDVRATDLPIGQFVKVKITDALEYDLIGAPV